MKNFFIIAVLTMALFASGTVAGVTGQAITGTNVGVEQAAEAHSTTSCREWSFWAGDYYYKFHGTKISNGYLWVGHKHYLWRGPPYYSLTLLHTAAVYGKCQRVYYTFTDDDDEGDPDEPDWFYLDEDE